MSRFDKGVEWYDAATATVTISFPEGERKCKWCGFCRMDSGFRQRCIITNDILYSTECIGAGCPLQFENREGQEHEEI